jgi:hypothetical protein
LVWNSDVDQGHRVMAVLLTRESNMVCNTEASIRHAGAGRFG